MTDMIGHNIGAGTDAHKLNSAVAGLGLALQDGRTTRKNDRNQMIVVARHLLAVDEAAAGDEALADAEIRTAGLILPADLLASQQERSNARWLARGGVRANVTKSDYSTNNNLSDLSAGAVNRLEGRFLTGRRFAKVTTYTAIYHVITRECRTEIRAALDGGIGAPGIKEVTESYEEFFKNSTIVGWINEETEKRSDEYVLLQDIKKAAAMRIESAKTDKELIATLAQAFAPELEQIRAKAAQDKAERDAKAAEKASAVKLSPQQRRIVQDTMKVAQEQGYAQEVTDEDFE